jgi:glycosyltransferase involved in cell wall biosynthesis
MATALHELIEDPVLRAGLGRAGREWALREGSFTTMAKRYDALYAARGVDVGDTTY